MNISFQCEACSKTLSANAVAAGRVITCPYCRKTTKVPRFEENVEQEKKVQTATKKTKIVPDSSTSSNESLWIDPTLDPDWEQMLKKFPNFKPNPFGISFPLDVASQEADANAEFDEEKQDSDENDGSASNQYSVDDLIKGVE